MKPASTVAAQIAVIGDLAKATRSETSTWVASDMGDTRGAKAATFLGKLATAVREGRLPMDQAALSDLANALFDRSQDVFRFRRAGMTQVEASVASVLVGRVGGAVCRGDLDEDIKTWI